MPRRSDSENVYSFSAPIDLLEAAEARAAALGMTKSGFYRYCLAKELGYPEAEALALSEHGQVRRLREQSSSYPPHRTQSTVIVEDAPNSKAAAAASKFLKKAARAPKACPRNAGPTRAHQRPLVHSEHGRR